MKKVVRPIVLGLAVGLIGLQFYRSPRNEGVAEGPSSIVAQHAVPAPVKEILQRACYDCHSNHTVYPWYASVQPVAWWLNQHVEEGKAELNLSDFTRYDGKRAVRKLQAVADEVREHSMPLKSYLWVHREARLTDAERTLVTNWAEDLADELGGK
jgi:uncharacterized membrane protein